MTKDELKELKKKFMRTFNTEDGKGVLKHLEEKYVDRKGYIKGMDALECVYREGQRDVIMDIKKKISDDDLK